MELVGAGPQDEKPRRVVVRGQVEAGAEHGAVVLVADPGGPGAATYQLGQAWQHTVGRRVDLVAQTVPGLATTAQQGIPVRVLSLVVVAGPGEPGPGEPGAGEPGTREPGTGEPSGPS